MDYLKTVAVAVLDCKQNVSFNVFRKVVYFMKSIYHFCYRLTVLVLELQGGKKIRMSLLSSLIIVCKIYLRSTEQYNTWS